jgi:phosphopantothenoylcysteine decarboxylase/phosphopantothenate--cysteine ligase
MVSGKNILIGITGGIAAYKTAHLVREFVKAGAHVKCIQTPASKSFITPLTLSTLSNNEVFSEFTTDEENPRWNDHVSLGLWADLFVIAPATANTLAKMRQGVCDNLLMATYLSAKCPVYFAPAMDLDMYKHPSTKENFSKLSSYGNIIIPAEHGELASGLVGEGRMAEPAQIYHFVCEDLKDKLPLNKRKVLVTAGPTYESIDPVRFIGNRSSGKMGCELALNFANQGADVQLILGPSAQNPVHHNISISRVESAKEMFDACMSHFTISDIVVAAAAVSDYSPASIHSDKLKKTEGLPHLELQQTKDILAHMGTIKKHQFLVGFALETTNEVENARSKLKRKNLDLIVLNSLNDKGAGFEFDTNKITLITKGNKMLSFELKSKQEVAEDIVNTILSEIDA